MQQKLIQQFQQQFNAEPQYIVQAPGRVNLIGDHTDYNEGFVLPIAINRYIWLAFSPRQDDLVRIYSMDFNEVKEFSVTDLHQEANNWIEYAKGVAKFMQDEFGSLRGFDGVLHGNISRGAGLSSSAALELTIARALAEVADIPWEPITMAKLCQQAENQWVGMNCGIMDQMIIAIAEANKALLLDCQSLAPKQVALPQNASIVIMDTNTRRGLVGSAYNERRSQCEEAARILNVAILRDVTADIWGNSQKMLFGKCLQRARHVITENQKVLDTVTAMQHNDLGKIGELMNASHVSLRDDFEVSTPNVNAMVTAAQNAVGCFGARMTGGGFGGCAVALVKAMYANDFVDQVTEQYEHETNLKPALYIAEAVAGTRSFPGSINHINAYN